MKRAFDVVVATTLALAASPVMMVVWVLIRWESGPPAIFRQSRVGRFGQTFTCYKFRTMRNGTGDVPTHMAPSSAVTRIGSWIRRFKLDELPQLFNVIRGDMSLVGPRPCLPTQLDLIERRRALGVLSVRPGITGLAQVNDIDMSDPERLARKDAEYLTNATIAGDIGLLLATFLGRGQGDRVKQ
jgi:O-antigen biosynthesis protein WbqP